MIIQIGPLDIEIEGINESRLPNDFGNLLLNSNHKHCQLHYYFEIVEELPCFNHNWKKIHTSKNIEIYHKNDLEGRYIYKLDNNSKYAMLREENESHIYIYLLNESIELIKNKSVFCSLLAIEKYLIKNNCIILHSSYIVKDNKAILFCGPSGIGKSTQARLWEKHTNAQIINEDRVLIYRVEKQYICLGWPYSGSDMTFRVGEYPLNKIILLSQNINNVITSDIRPVHFQKLISQITTNWWNKEFATEVLCIATDLINRNYLIDYSCNTEETAINTIKKLL